MDYDLIMHHALSLKTERGKKYGDMKATLERQAKIASLILGKVVTAYDVAMICHAVKLGRLEENRTNEDNYVDGINYYAFAASFATSPQDTLEDDIVAMAKRLAPRKQENANEESNGGRDGLSSNPFGSGSPTDR